MYKYYEVLIEEAYVIIHRAIKGHIDLEYFHECLDLKDSGKNK